MRRRASRPAGVIATVTTRPSAVSGDALDEAELLELAHLAAGRRRVHAGRAGEVAERRRAVLVDAAQQRVRGTGQVDPAAAVKPRVPVAAGPEPVELLEPPLDRAPRRPRAGP